MPMQLPFPETMLSSKGSKKADPPSSSKTEERWLIAIVLDRPLAEAQALVDQPLQFLQEMKQVLDDQKTHPLLEQMLRTIQGDAMREASSSTSSKRRQHYMDDDKFQ